MKALIEALLDLGRIEAAEIIEFIFKRMDLGQIVKNVVEPFEGPMVGREFIVDGIADIPTFVADELRVAHVFRHLVSSAEKFSLKERPIQIRGSLVNGMVRVRVIGQRPGMSQKQ